MRCEPRCEDEGEAGIRRIVAVLVVLALVAGGCSGVPAADRRPPPRAPPAKPKPTYTIAKSGHPAARSETSRCGIVSHRSGAKHVAGRVAIPGLDMYAVVELARHQQRYQQPGRSPRPSSGSLDRDRQEFLASPKASVASPDRPRRSHAGRHRDRHARLPHAAQFRSGSMLDLPVQGRARRSRRPPTSASSSSAEPGLACEQIGDRLATHDQAGSRHPRPSPPPVAASRCSSTPCSRCRRRSPAPRARRPVASRGNSARSISTSPVSQCLPAIV